MQITRFEDMYIAELQELRSLEGQLGDAMLRAAEMASHPGLKNALMRQREQAQVQEQRLQTLLSEHEADPRAHTDQAMQALIGETGKMLSMVKGNDLRDAALIGSAQKVCHYQIAAYGTVAVLAGQLELRRPRVAASGRGGGEGSRPPAQPAGQERGQSGRAGSLETTPRRRWEPSGRTDVDGSESGRRPWMYRRRPVSRQVWSATRLERYPAG